mgnify:CR=1 FL=1
MGDDDEAAEGRLGVPPGGVDGIVQWMPPRRPHQFEQFDEQIEPSFSLSICASFLRAKLVRAMRFLRRMLCNFRKAKLLSTHFPLEIC